MTDVSNEQLPTIGGYGQLDHFAVKRGGGGVSVGRLGVAYAALVAGRPRAIGHQETTRGQKSMLVVFAPSTTTSPSAPGPVKDGSSVPVPLHLAQ